jgi:hypothetical protein
MSQPFDNSVIFGNHIVRTKDGRLGIIVPTGPATVSTPYGRWKGTKLDRRVYAVEDACDAIEALLDGASGGGA